MVQGGIAKMEESVIEIHKVIVGTESALKLRAVKAAFEGLGHEVEVVPCKAESGIGIQPIGTEEMIQGASNRAEWARSGDIDQTARYCIGIENGLVQLNGLWFDPTCVVIVQRGGRRGIAFGAHFPIPRWVVDRVLDEKTELGEVVKRLAGGGEKDPMKYFSEDKIAREHLLAQAIQCALVPLLYHDRYQDY